MRRMRLLLTLALAGAWGLQGCKLFESQTKIPRPPEEFTVPPDNDPRYNRPIEYPKETLNQDPLAPKLNKNGTPGSVGPGLGGNRGRPGMTNPY